VGPSVLPRTRHVLDVFRWVFVDTLIILLAYSVSFSARAVTTSLHYPTSYGFMFLIIAITLGLLYAFGAYNRIWSSTSGHDVALIMKAIAAAALITSTADVFVKPRPLPLSVVLFANSLAFVGFVAVRYRSRMIRGLTWRWEAIWNKRFPQIPTKVLIIGAGESGQMTAWRLKYRCPPGSCYRVVGFIDDDPLKRGMYVQGCPILGSCEDIPAVAEQYGVDLIVIAIRNITDSDFRRIFSLAECTKARIKVIPDMFDLLECHESSPLLRHVQAEDLLGREPIGRDADVNLDLVKNKVILVTGAAGSIGSELSRQLIAYNPVKLILLDNNESALNDLSVELNTCELDHRIIATLADITDKGTLDGIFAQHSPQIVFHSAAYKHVPMLENHPAEAVRVNVCGTRHLADLASHYRVERFVLISTDKAVNPTSSMGASKRICELVMHAMSQQRGNGTLFTSVRFGNVLGSRGSVVPIFNRQIDAGGPVTVTHKDMMRYFMTIPEAVNLVIHAACLTTGNDLFMLKMGEEVRIVELAERMIRMRGLRPYEDIAIKFTEARPGEKLHEELHSLRETPVETSHPDIVQLIGQIWDFEPQAFLHEVDALFDMCQSGRPDVGDRLLRIASSGEACQMDSARPPGLAGAALSLEPNELRIPARSEATIVRGESHEMNIPMSSPDISRVDIEAVNEVLRTRWLSLGPKLEQFEGAFAAYVGTKGAVGVNSGTSGLHLAMIATGVGKDDEVITPSFSFIASANCVLYVGARPIFVDVDPLTYNLYPLALEEAITQRTKAIVVVHAFGQPADMDPILDIARKHGLLVIEDACEAIGAEYKERRAGTMSDAAVFAFYPNKQMTTGEGGMIVTDNEAWLELFRSLRNQGRDVFDAWLCHSRLGYNYRMDEMSAALGLSQLQRIDELLAKRAQVAAWYDERIAPIPFLHKPYIAATTSRMSWFVYVIRCSDRINRNSLMSYLAENGIASRPYFTPTHLQPFYQRHYHVPRAKLFNTEKAGDSLLALPFSGVMTEEQVDYVCQHLRLGTECARVAKQNIGVPAGHQEAMSM
jgi:perosamine synthetase